MIKWYHHFSVQKHSSYLSSNLRSNSLGSNLKINLKFTKSPSFWKKYVHLNIPDLCPDLLNSFFSLLCLPTYSLLCLWYHHLEAKVSFKIKNKNTKMVTRVQKQTEWALWIKNLAETLQPHLLEINHQGKSRLWHPEPLARRKLLQAMLHWENRWAATTTSHWLQTCLGDI
jgi:hypothetical protein